MKASDDGRGWVARPGISFALRVVARVVPLAAGIALSFAIATRWRRPGAFGEQLGWWVVVLAASGVAMYLAERVTRRLLPLSMLLSLSLTFPEQTPSRFRAALRAGNSRTALAQRSELESTAVGRRRGDLGKDQAAYVLTLLAEVAKHDRSTRGHIERVRAYSQLIGEEMGLPDDDLNRLQFAALLHDVGKLDVPAEILAKPAALDDAEFERIQSHPADGARWVAPLRPWLGEWLDATVQHHERFDAGGYPLGIDGKQMSLSSRIVAVADAYDVMTAARSYKAPKSHQFARHELTAHAGTQFDPVCVRAFLHASVGQTHSVSVWGWLLNIPALSFLAAPAAATAAATVAVASVAVGAVGLAEIVDIGAGAPRVEVAAEAPNGPVAFVDVGSATSTMIPATPLNTALPMPVPQSPETSSPGGATTETVAPTFVFGWPTTTEPATDGGLAPTTIPKTASSTTSTTSTTPPNSTTTTSAPAATTTTTTAPATTTTTATPTTTTTPVPVPGCDIARASSDGASLAGCDLSGLDLSGIDLGGVDLTGADLSGSDLSDAKLQGATLVDADLSGADLTNAKLLGVDADGVNLEGANLSNAKMQDGDFSGARLVNADIHRAHMDEADFSDANLRGATGNPIDGDEADWDGAICPNGSVGDCFDD